MKKSMLVAGLLQFVAALVLAAPAVAQQSPYSIQVPFPFHVDARVLPAGEYSIGTIASRAVTVRSVDHVVNATFGAIRVNPSSHRPLIASLVFHRYGEQYFLSEVWFGAGDQGYGLTASHTEREYARQGPSAETVLRAAK
jgi:hypothetical protein